MNKYYIKTENSKTGPYLGIHIAEHDAKYNMGLSKYEIVDGSEKVYVSKGSIKRTVNTKPESENISFMKKLLGNRKKKNA